jgi:hypothetical protein
MVGCAVDHTLFWWNGPNKEVRLYGGREHVVQRFGGMNARVVRLRFGVACFACWICVWMRCMKWWSRGPDVTSTAKFSHHHRLLLRRKEILPRAIFTGPVVVHVGTCAHFSPPNGHRHTSPPLRKLPLLHGTSLVVPLPHGERALGTMSRASDRSNGVRDARHRF